MAIKAKFNRNYVRKMVESQWQRIESDLFLIMAKVGEEFVTNARNAISIDSGAYPKGDYMDDTSNLRSSVGYFILKDGKIVISKTQGSAKGQQAAKSMLSEISAVKRGYHLIGVAGMEYASYLEAMGYNVITSQSLVALVDVEKQLKAYAAKKGFDMEVNYTGVMVQMR